MNRFLLLICAATIFTLGLVMIFSTTSAEVLDHDLNTTTHHALFKQLIYAGLGLFIAVICYQIGFDRLIEWSPYLFWGSVFLLILVLIPGIGREVNGSKRWLSVGGVSLQPSEFVKYIAPAFFIHKLNILGAEEITLASFLKLIFIVFLPVSLIMVEPNNGTAAVVMMTIILLCFIMKVPFKFWAFPLGIAFMVGLLFASQLPYFSNRIKVYLHPELDLRGRGHQPYQAKIAAGSGGLFGKGPGNGLQKLSYLPEAQNDYIAAIFAEEMGFSGILCLILLYMCVGYAGFSIASQTPFLIGSFYATVITFLIVFQAFLNMGVVSGLLPSTGLNLPWFSQGGTSLMANFMGLGILLSISENYNPQST